MPRSPAASPAGGDCPECGGRVVADGREVYCRDCGAVVDADPIDRGPDWRSFPDDGREPERTGAPRTVTRHDYGLGSEIGYDNDLSDARARLFHRLRRTESRETLSKTDRNLIYCLTDVQRMTTALGLGKPARETASVTVRQAQDEDLLRGRALEYVAAGAVYAACRLQGLPRTVGDVAAVARCPADKVRLGYTALNRELGLPAGPTPPAAFVPRLVSATCDDDRVRRRATALAEAVADAFDGRHPAGVAAACVYAAAVEYGLAGRDVTQRALADEADVTPVTLRTAYYDVRDHVDGA